MISSCYHTYCQERVLKRQEKSKIFGTSPEQICVALKSEFLFRYKVSLYSDHLYSSAIKGLLPFLKILFLINEYLGCLGPYGISTENIGY